MCVCCVCLGLVCYLFVGFVTLLFWILGFCADFVGVGDCLDLVIWWGLICYLFVLGICLVVWFVWWVLGFGFCMCLGFLWGLLFG